jgi:hypothetical protein
MDSTAFLLLANSSSEVNKKPENGVDDQKSELLRRIFKFDSPVRSGGTRSVGKKNQDNHDVWIISGLFERGKLAGQLRSGRKYKIEELDETTEKLDIRETVDQSYISQKDLVTRSGDVSRNIHQLCVIITEATEENDHADNTVIDAQVDKSRSNSKKQKEKIYVFTREWRIIMSAINHGTEVPTNSRK